MADSSQDKNKINVDDAIDSINSYKSALFSANDQINELLKSSEKNSLIWKDTSTRTTALNRSLTESVTILAKVNTEYVKRSTINRVLTNLQAQQKVLQSAFRVNEAKLSAQQKENATQLAASLIQQTKLDDEIKAIQTSITDKHLEREAVVKRLLELDAKGKKNSKEALSLVEKNKKIKEDITSESIKQTKLGKDLKKTTDTVKQLETEKSLNEKILDLTKQQIEYAEKATNDYKAKIPEIEKSNKALRQGKFWSELISRIPILRNFKDAPAHMEAFGKAGFIALTAVSAIALAVAAVVKLVTQADSKITDMSNQLGLSKDAGKELYNQFAKSVSAAGGLNSVTKEMGITIGQQKDAQAELNALYGTSTIFTQQSIQDQFALTKAMGLTADEAAKINALGMLNNESATAASIQIAQQVVNFQKVTGIRLDNKRVVQEVAKIEGQLAAQYRNNPALIAKAVILSKQFGLNLEQAKESADSLLNFESSISNQIEAELVTGKRLNFEKARSLALDGKSAEAAAELMKQMGSAADFSKLNIIQQNTLAKSIGLSTNELANSLRYQQLLKGSTKETRTAIGDMLKQYEGTSQYAQKLAELQAATTGEQLVKNKENLSIQLKFEQAMERIKDAVSNLFTQEFINKLEHIVNVLVEKIPSIIGGISTAFHVIGKVYGVVKGISDYTPVGALGNYLTGDKVHDSVISPKGQITISTPRGQISPDKDDSVITTTNPGSLLGGGGGNNKVLEDKLDKLIAILGKGGNVYLDSKKVGTTQALAYAAYK